MNQTTMRAPRQLNLEALRIAAMVMIVLQHFLIHGGILQAVNPGSINYILAFCLKSFTLFAVNCYVLISGYFLIKSKFRIKKLLLLTAQILFYSLLIYLLLAATGCIPFSLKNLLFSFFPILTRRYWFVTIYIGMYLLSPFANKLIESLTQRQHALCILLLFLLFSVWPNIFYSLDPLDAGGGHGIAWFLTLYMIAAYLRLYYTPQKGQGKKLLACYLLMVIIPPLFKIVYTSLFNRISLNLAGPSPDLLYEYHSIPVLVASVSLFMAFLHLKIKSSFFSKIIIFLAPLTFGVYLIHDNAYLRPVLWDLLKVSSFANNWYMVFLALFITVAIYLCCSLIEKLRCLLFRPLENSNWFTRLGDKIVTVYHYAVNLIMRI